MAAEPLSAQLGGGGGGQLLLWGFAFPVAVGDIWVAVSWS